MCDEKFEEFKLVRSHLVKQHKVSFFDLPKVLTSVKKIPCKNASKGCAYMFSTPERHLKHQRYHKCCEKFNEHVENCKFSPHNIQKVKCKLWSHICNLQTSLTASQKSLPSTEEREMHKNLFVRATIKYLIKSEILIRIAIDVIQQNPAYSHRIATNVKNHECNPNKVNAKKIPTIPDPNNPLKVISS